MATTSRADIAKARRLISELTNTQRRDLVTVLQVRISQNDKAALSKMARDKGQPMSKFVRESVADAVRKAARAAPSYTIPDGNGISQRAVDMMKAAQSKPLLGNRR